MTRLLEYFHYKSFVSVNGIYISAKEISDRLCKHVEILVRYDENFTSFAGSATLLDCNGRQVAVTTGHQIVGSDIQWLGLLDRDGSKIVTSNGCHFPKFESDDLSELHDLVIFDFSQSVYSGALSRDMFFPVSSGNLIKNGDQISVLNIFGYAFDEQNFEIAEVEPYEVVAMRSTKRDMLAHYQGATNDDSAFYFQYLEPLVSFDGFSGGGVFAILKDQHLDFRVVFAGLITRSSGCYGYGIKGDAVARIVSAAMGESFDNLIEP